MLFRSARIFLGRKDFFQAYDLQQQAQRTVEQIGKQKALQATLAKHPEIQGKWQLMDELCRYFYRYGIRLSPHKKAQAEPEKPFNRAIDEGPADQVHLNFGYVLDCAQPSWNHILLQQKDERDVEQTFLFDMNHNRHEKCTFEGGIDRKSVV